ncbi:hypothetical protein SmJEL517_g01915 [Synchytrium microbalum]|uniref:ATP-grasp domain-containing protein n=1 Tax=Synchytrium microbalum TaxID=1806994 RepID=A0A507CCY6_9FUNG|nr:uncharacterized protein SmJEL517_g01915 [Synchytrium microbalum]TPX35784.1 hypothetical protein SmJEL517_g01915 [Synchytrium microbalum]
MNILVLGSGGREHALALQLAASPSVSKVYVAPGNGGTHSSGSKIHNVTVNIHGKDFSALAPFLSQHDIGLLVPGPEEPLVNGVAEAAKKLGIPCFGPSSNAARIEGSKAWSKDFMKRHSIPTAEYKTFTSYDDAVSFVKSFKGALVIKASGLAAGKGVMLPQTKDEAIKVLKDLMVDRIFGDAGSEVVIEECLSGEEVSLLAITDGYTVVTLPPCQDHKRVFDGDKGPNTGGMGAYAPAPIMTPKLLAQAVKTILQPAVDGMRKEGFPFVGCLYAGLMLTSSGLQVIEFNARFGDPETQVIMPLLSKETDLAQVFLAAAEGRLDSVDIEFAKDTFAATVVLAAPGYPGNYPKGKAITLKSTTPADVHIYHAGTTSEGKKLVTSGGRVLAVSAVGATLQDALKLSYATIKGIHFEGMQYRSDIGHRAIAHLSSKKANGGATYEDAGVSIDSGNLLVDKIKAVVKATRRSGADADIGGFGGVFDLKAAGFRDPILVSGTDGVGTKLKVAQAINKHDTIGIDLVAMSVNDVIVQGAEPLFFLDYYACSKLEVEVCKDVVTGVASACMESGCALIGGETAEMPGLYEPGDYDLAGFVVAAVEREQLLPRFDLITPGDALLGIPSSGVHSNGFSLVRYLVEKSGLEYTSPSPFDTPTKKSGSVSIGEAFLEPTKLYVKPLLPIVKKGLVKSMAHITGGGFTDNVPRALPDHLGVVIDAKSFPLLPVFKWMKGVGNVADEEMARTFNCGIGMVIVLNQSNVAEVKAMLQAVGETVYEIGMVVDLKANGGNPVKMLNMDVWSK